jgi:hypothetical protein
MWLFNLIFMLPHVVVTSGVITPYGGVHRKIEDSRINYLPLVPPFVSKVAYLLWLLMTKGERLKKI